MNKNTTPAERFRAEAEKLIPALETIVDPLRQARDAVDDFQERISDMLDVWEEAREEARAKLAPPALSVTGLLEVLACLEAGGHARVAEWLRERYEA